MVVSVQGISRFQGKKELFREVSFHINPGDKIGLIGLNGVGKTTLFHILMGATDPDTGMVVKPRNLRFGHLPQEWSRLEGKSVLSHAMDVHEQLEAVQSEIESLQDLINSEVDAERVQELAFRHTNALERAEHLGGYDLEARALKVLSGLGFREEQLASQTSSLSGGWVMRLELARLLLAEPDILLLDEPTNHLDLESLVWLEQYLTTSKSAMVVISHDRAFLNRVVSRVLELENGRLQEFTGNYDKYLEEKALRQEIRLASFKNQQERIKQIERFIERNRYRKDRSRQAQSRIKLLEKMDIIESEGVEDTIHFVFPEPARSGKRTIELRQILKSYDDHVIYAGLDLTIERNDRIAFLGANGAGKSTLLKILAGVEAHDGGDRELGHQVRLGYYAQYQLEQLNAEWTVLQEAASVAGDLPQSQLRSLLGAFLFRGDDVLKRISVLSGGEKARLTLCKLLLERPNVLLLDEPTNHLDIPSRDVLERALEEFPGAICFISHDRHFINTIANKVLVVQSGRIHLFPGNYDEFQTIWKSRLDGLGDPGERGTGRESKSGSRQDDQSVRKGQEQRRIEAERRNELHRLKKPLQDRISEIENSLQEAHKLQEGYNALLADPATYQPGTGSRVQEIQKEYQECQVMIQRLTQEWEENAIALEELEAGFHDKRKNSCEQEVGPRSTKDGSRRTRQLTQTGF